MHAYEAAAFLYVLLMLAAVALGAGCGGHATQTLPSAPTQTLHIGETTVPIGPAPVAVLIGDGNGNTAALSMPQALAGGNANMTVTLTNSLPSGVVVPTNHARGGGTIPFAAPVKPSVAGATVTSVEYINLTMDDTVGMADAPTVTFSLGSTSIAPAQQTYLLLWDPAVSGQQGWIVLLGPGVVGGSARNVVRFDGVRTGQTFVAYAQYVYALVTTSQTPATASPAPVPTGLPAPRLPAYCAGFATASPDPAIGLNVKPQPLVIQDNSGLAGANIVLYVTDTGQLQDGSTPPPGAVNVPYYARALNKQGQWATPNPVPPKAPMTTPIQAFPLACFPGSIKGKVGRQFLIPVAASGLLYIAYAPNAQPSTVPDPLASALAFNASGPPSNYSVQAPSLDWRAGLSGGFVTTPWDVIEYNLGPNPSMDTTQENKIGLPLEVQQGAIPGQGAVDVGFGPGAYQNVLNDLKAHAPFDRLPSYASFGGANILTRIMAPGSAAYYGFPQDYFYNAVNYQTGGPYYAQSGLKQGYIGYLLQQYQTHPQTYTINGAGKGSNNHVFCATSNGANTFTFTDVGTPAAGSNVCASATPPTPLPGGATYSLPAWNTLEGSPIGAMTAAYCQTAIFLMAPGANTDFNPPLADANAYWLWKGLILDVARGMALQDVVHPYSGWNTGSGALAPSPAVSNYWQDTVYDYWAWALHREMLQGKAYALQYDEPGGMSTAFTPDNTGRQPLTITVQNIPPAPADAILTPTTGGAAPWPIPPGLPCPTGPLPTQ